VNGRPWPVRDDTTLWLPAGSNVIEPALKEPAIRILDFNGNLRSAKVSPAGVQIAYQSNSRGIAVVGPRPGKIEIDGAEYGEKLLESGSNVVLMLPRGQHVVEIGSSSARIFADDR
jgi:hypothetical protein